MGLLAPGSPPHPANRPRPHGIGGGSADGMGGRPGRAWRTGWHRSWRRSVARHRRLLVAALLAAATATGLHVLAPRPPASTVVQVAARDLPTGHVLTDSDLTTSRWPVSATPEGLVHAAVGAVLGSPVRRGEPITDARLRGPDLLAGLGTGPAGGPRSDLRGDLRAVVVRLAAPTAGWVRPGDRVDVVADGSTPGLPSAGTEPAQVVAVNAVVLATGSPGGAAATTAGPAAPGILGDGSSPSGATSDGAHGDLVVLAADPSSARALAAAGISGSLNVVIRGPGR